jgi:kynurenine formamidase
MKRVYDLSHVIEDGMITYKGLPAPVICDYLSREKSRSFYEAGTEFQIGKIEMVANTGTYIDCPFHRYADGQDLSQVDLVRFVNLDAVVIHAPYQDSIEITPSHFQKTGVRGRAVLVHTGWSSHWRTDQYFENHPFLSADAARYLLEQNVKLVGIDSHNIDDTRGKSRPVHSILLKEGILIVEHLCNLELLPDRPLKFNAVPPKFKGVGTFPVRAYAVEF